jgi:hypothetical protein
MREHVLSRESTRVIRTSGSACVSRAGDGVSPSRTFPRLRELTKPVSAGRRNQHARRARYPTLKSKIVGGHRPPLPKRTGRGPVFRYG